jgi:AAA ATPase domain
MVERVGELRALDGWLDRARLGGGRFVLVEGPAGIGKTSLLDASIERGPGLDLQVLPARGDEVAMESPFSAVRELLWPGVAGSEGELLAGAAQFAAPVFDVVADAGESRDRVGAVLHGLYWLVANLADRRPLLLVLDDAHWLDPASARFILYLARRIESLPVLLLAAARPGEGADPIGGVPALSAVADTILRPSPLSELGAGVLVRREVGTGAQSARPSGQARPRMRAPRAGGRGARSGLAAATRGSARGTRTGGRAGGGRPTAPRRAVRPRRRPVVHASDRPRGGRGRAGAVFAGVTAPATGGPAGRRDGTPGPAAGRSPLPSGRARNWWPRARGRGARR